MEGSFCFLCNEIVEKKMRENYIKIEYKIQGGNNIKRVRNKIGGRISVK